MASTEDLVPVRSSRCPSCRSCGSNWVTKWLRKRLDKTLSSQAAVGIIVCVTVCVAVASFLSFQDAISNCEDKSEVLLIVFIVFVYLGIPCLAAMAYAIRRDAFVTDDRNKGFRTESLELSLIFVSFVLPAVGCAALDVVFFLLLGSCFHRDGSFPTSSASYRVGMAFHVGRLVFVVTQVAMVGWCFRTRSFARQKVYTALLFTAVVMSNLASWFYEIVDRPSVLCTNNNTCWDTAASKSDTCRDVDAFTVEYCTYVQFQLYCQPLVGTFAMLSVATMYRMWTIAHEGRPAREQQNVTGRRRARAAAGALAKLFTVTVAVLSVTFWAITHQATTVSSSADYYKVVLYYSVKVLYSSLFTISTIAGCVRTRAVGPTAYRPRVADILLLLLSAAGLLVFVGRVLWGVGSQASVPFPYTPPGCMYHITEGDFGKLRAVLIADVVLTLAQLILQTTSLLSAISHKQLEGSVESHYGLLCLFNFCVWINGSFFEVQSTPLVTCYTTPVPRAGFGDWNVFLHLLEPVCTFYWLWSLLLMMRLLLQRVRVSPGCGGTTEAVHARRSPTVSAAVELPALRDAHLPHASGLSHDA